MWIWVLVLTPQDSTVKWQMDTGRLFRLFLHNISRESSSGLKTSIDFSPFYLLLGAKRCSESRTHSCIFSVTFCLPDWQNNRLGLSIASLKSHLSATKCWTAAVPVSRWWPDRSSECGKKGENIHKSEKPHGGAAALPSSWEHTWLWAVLLHCFII